MEELNIPLDGFTQVRKFLEGIKRTPKHAGAQIPHYG